MKKTAIDWLIDKHFGGIENVTPDFKKHIEQAKEMEKEQIKDAFVNGFCNAQDTEDKSLNADTIFYRTRYGGNK